MKISLEEEGKKVCLLYNSVVSIVLKEKKASLSVESDNEGAEMECWT